MIMQYYNDYLAASIFLWHEILLLPNSQFILFIFSPHIPQTSTPIDKEAQLLKGNIECLRVTSESEMGVVWVFLLLYLAYFLWKTLSWGTITSLVKSSLFISVHY